MRATKIVSAFVLTACFICFIAGSVTAQLCPDTSAGGESYSPWPKFHFDNRNTGKTFNFGTKVGKLKWKFITGAPVTSSPVMHCEVEDSCYDNCLDTGETSTTACVKECQDCTIYVGSADNYLYAIDAETGMLEWKYQTDASIELASPAIDSNHVLYIGSNDGYLYAFDLTTIDANDPEPKWIYNARSDSTGKGTSSSTRPIAAISSSPAIADDGSILYTSNDGYLYSLNPNGTRNWRTYIGESWTSPAIDEDSSLVYAGSWEDQIVYDQYVSDNGTVLSNSWPMYASFYGLNLADGADDCTDCWYWPGMNCTPGGIHASPVVKSDGDVIVSWFLTNDAWALEDYCDDECSDSNVWVTGIGTCLDIGGNDVYSTPASIEDNSFIVVSGPDVYRILPDGATYFSIATLGERSESSPAVDGQKNIYLGSNGGYMYAMNADSPETPILWQYPPEGAEPLRTEDNETIASIISSPAIGDDNRHSVYVGASDGCVYAFYDGARIYGKVELISDDGSDKTPLDSVKLTMTSPYSSEVRTTYTDPDGNYEFPGVENYSYTITPDKIGYVFSPSSATALITRDQDAELNFEAFTGFSISGTITDSSGSPVSGATVVLEGDQTNRTSTSTDSSGRYSFTGLSYDTYTITPSLANNGFTPPFQEVTISSASSGDKTGIDFTATEGYQISGKVTRFTTQKGMSSVTVSLQGTTTDNKVVTESTTTETDGAYSFVGLDPGTYTITPALSGFDFEPSSKSVTIAANNVDGVDFTAASGYSISGSFSASSGVDNATVASISVDLYEDPGSLINQELSDPINTASPDSGGNFVFIGVEPGNYIVKPRLTGYGFTPISSSVTVANSDVSNLIFTITQGFYVSGTVTNLIGTPLANIEVVLLQDDSETSATTNADGKYTFSGLETGDYQVYISSDYYTSYPSSRSVTITNTSFDDEDFFIKTECAVSMFVFPFAGTNGTLVNIYGYNFGWDDPPDNETLSVSAGDGEGESVTLNAGVYFGKDDPNEWVRADDIWSWSDIKVVVEAPRLDFGLYDVWIVRKTSSDSGCGMISQANFFLYVP